MPGVCPTWLTRQRPPAVDEEPAQVVLAAAAAGGLDPLVRAQLAVPVVPVDLRAGALVERVREAAEQTGAGRIAVVGGVAANSELRAGLPDAALAPLELCTDNAAMIASAGRFIEPVPYPGYLGLDAYASR